MGRVLVVDDEMSIRDVLEVLIEAKGHQVRTAGSVNEACALLDKECFDLVVTDLRLDPDGDGVDVVRAARSRSAPPEVIVMTAYGTRAKARDAVSAGASYYLEKGAHLAADVEVLVSQAINTRRLQEDNERLRSELSDPGGTGLIGRSEAMQEVFALIDRIQTVDANVLISGESGTGKERVARLIHARSPHGEGPFVAVNCGAIPENLMESELFGHVKGSFTGAEQNKDGLFVSAAGGTVFLDEVGELPLSLQPKLLRVLQERTVRPVGANREVPIEVRVMAATNRDLEQEARAGRFREDLFFRLNVLPVDLPPLRERKEDIPALVDAFVRRFAAQYHRPMQRVAPEAMEALVQFAFPGNVRQLENTIERAVALSDGEALGLELLPAAIRTPQPRQAEGLKADEFPEEGLRLEERVEALELGLIREALQRAGGVKTRAAELLGLSSRQFRYKYSKYEKDLK